MLVGSSLLFGARCSPTEPNELDQLGFVDMTIQGKDFRLWIADSTSETSKGLMFVTAEEMAPLANGTERGMIFVFGAEQRLSFWMRNTIIPLDIAYLNNEGEVVNTHTMAPLDDDLNKYPSGAPARFAIEVNAGLWEEIGLNTGDIVDIPDSILNR
jgi:uncharacterized membrane protein (UPF0127 family)